MYLHVCMYDMQFDKGLFIIQYYTGQPKCKCLALDQQKTQLVHLT